MTRAGCLLAAVLATACGGTPSRPESPPAATAPAYGAVPAAGAQITLRPERVARLFARLDTLLTTEDAGTLGPLGVLWKQLRQRVADRLDDLFDAQGDALTAWGVDGSEPIVVTVAGVQGPDRARVLLRVLQILGGVAAEDADPAAAQAALDAALRDAPGALWHVRAQFTLRDPGALAGGLTRMAARSGLDAHTAGEPPRSWLSGATLPPDAIWVGHDPEAGWSLLARARGAQGVADLVVPAGPRTRVDAQLAVAQREGEPWLATGAEAATLSLRLGAMAPLEAGFTAHLALDAATTLDGAARIELLTDAAHVTAACAGRWRQLDTLADEVRLAVDLDGDRPAVVAAARLTGGGAGAWSAAVTPPVVGAAAAALPAGFTVRLDRDRFTTDAGPGLPASLPAFLEEMSACGPAHPLPALLGALLVLPAFLEVDALPLPTLGSGPLVERSLAGAAGLLLGFGRDEGDAVPFVGAVAVAPSEAVVHSADPLGPEGTLEMTPLGPRWTLPGPGLARGFARQTRPAGREAVLLALGEGALERLEALVGEAATTGPEFLDAWADPEALARQLEAAGRPGAEADALAVVGRRLGRVRLRGHVEGSRLTYRLELDRPVGAE